MEHSLPLTIKSGRCGRSNFAVSTPREGILGRIAKPDGLPGISPHGWVPVQASRRIDSQSRRNRNSA